MSMSNWLRGDAFKKEDEFYTPRILVDAILPFVPRRARVWCPFDTAESEFVTALPKTDVVVPTHIWTGDDFFTTNDARCTHIISNPPYSRKLEVLDRLFSLGKPFAMVLPLPMLNYQEVGKFMSDKNLQLLIPDKKVSFNGHTASFNSAFFCFKFLPKDLMFAHLEHNNTGKNFVPSAMLTKYGDMK